MEDLRITRLVLKDIGVFKNLDLNFQKNQPKDKAEIHIFTGENGTGKTTLLEALTYFDYEFNKELNDLNKEKKRYDLLHEKGNYAFDDDNNLEIHFKDYIVEFVEYGDKELSDNHFLKKY